MLKFLVFISLCILSSIGCIAATLELTDVIKDARIITSPAKEESKENTVNPQKTTNNITSNTQETKIK